MTAMASRLAPSSASWNLPEKRSATVAPAGAVLLAATEASVAASSVGASLLPTMLMVMRLAALSGETVIAEDGVLQRQVWRPAARKSNASVPETNSQVKPA